MTDYSITSFLAESNDELLIQESDDCLLNIEDMLVEAVEERVEFEKDIEAFQIYNQDHTNNLDPEFMDNLDPDNTEAVNSSVSDDEESNSGMQVVTFSESISLVEQLLNETAKTSTELPDEDTDVLSDFNEDDTYDVTDLDEY